jgi:hypothetical protein
MITIVDKNTEEILYCSNFEVALLENEIAVDGLSGEFTHYNLLTKEFYTKNE